MSTTKNEKCKGKHFTWSKPISHMLLEVLAEVALKKNKASSTFKSESFLKVTTKISQKFNLQCKSKHVKNHLKTIIKEWGIITKFTNKSSFGSLQDFTVLLTKKFCRCVNRSSSVIFLPTSSPTDYVCRLSFRR
jgi:hypothetical protein